MKIGVPLWVYRKKCIFYESGTPPYFMYFRTILYIFRLNPLYLYNYTTPILETFLENYIDTTIEALGDIYAWDVVNEPISNDDDEGHRVDDVW